MRGHRYCQCHWMAVIAIAALVLATSACGPREVEEADNPFEYDVEAFLDVDPALLKYQQVASLAVDGLPFGLATGPDGRIYVTVNNGLLVFYQDQLEQKIALDESVTCLAVAADQRIYLGMLDKIMVMSADRARTSMWNELGDRALVTSIAVDEEQVLVADAGNRVVLRYDFDGKLLAEIGRKDPEQDIPGFVIPSPYFDVAVDGQGFIWVINPGRQLIECYNQYGDLRSSWGESGMEIDGFCGCCNPTHLALLDNGSFVTSEKGLPRVKITAPTGQLQAVVAGPRQLAEGTVGLDLAIDTTGRILVLDPAAQMVRVFVEKEQEVGL